MNKIIQMKTIAIILICFVLQLISINTYSFNNSRYQKQCKNTLINFEPKKYFRQFDSYFNYQNNTQSTLTSSILLQSFLSKGSIKDNENQLLNYLIPLIIAVFGFYTLLMWLFLLPLWYYNAWIFQPNKDPNPLRDQLPSCCLILFMAILFMMSFEIKLSSNITEDLNESSCALISLIDHSLNGDSELDLPRWSGIVQMRDVIQRTNDTLNYIMDNTSKVFNEESTYNKIDTLRKGFLIEVDKLEERSKKIRVMNPNGSNIELMPVYAVELSDRFTRDTSLYKLLREDNYYVEAYIRTIKNIRNKTELIRNNHTMILKLINIVDDNLTSFINSFETIDNTILKNMLTFQRMISHSIIILLYVISGMNIFILIGVTPFIFFYIIECVRLKYLLHSVWNIILLNSTLSFFLAALVYLIGILSESLPYIANDILHTTIYHDSTDIFLNKCLNDNGDIANSLGLNNQSSSIAVINDLYGEFEQLTDHKNDINRQDTESNQIRNIRMGIFHYQSDYQTSLPNKAFENEQKKINEELNKCYPGKEYSVALIKRHCLIDYKESIQFPNEEKLCYIIEEDNSSINCPEAEKLMAIYYKAYEDGKLKASYVSRDLDNLQKVFMNFMKHILYTINELEPLNQMITNKNDIIVGDHNTFHDLFDCRFLNDDLIMFLDLFSKHFSSSCQYQGLLCTLSSSLSLIAVFLIIHIIYYYPPEIIDLDSSNPASTVEIELQAIPPHEGAILFESGTDIIQLNASESSTNQEINNNIIDNQEE